MAMPTVDKEPPPDAAKIERELLDGVEQQAQAERLRILREQQELLRKLQNEADPKKNSG